MTSALVKWQLAGLILIALAGLVYVGAQYVRLDNLLGFGEYTVSVELANSGDFQQCRGHVPGSSRRPRG